ncbi:sulfite exporter TauE/SafE family protein [Pseudonocardia humida]|uniref:Probable membrane transporter protein n=1 Tax=Pseudonocardia humida TaxID=2800819 RepID=A0ABT1A6U4_9PSEU|nr:sulfite exporter TauE/SafE family protein [Pseudonocardia humida]MCO1658656.1 sulfite exporter TauE/SafE family protein [Pseudonocardia humida]
MIGLLAAGLGLLVGGVIGGLGGGGGVLTVPVLVYLLGQPVPDATTGSIVIVGAAALVGGLARARSGDVDWPTGLGFGLVGIPTAVLGSLANRAVPGPVLLLGVAALTLTAAAAMLLDARRHPAGPVDEAPSGDVRTGGVATRRARALVPIALWGAGTGFLTGLLGVGGGFLVVPVLVVVLRLTTPRAIGTSLVVIAVNAAAALAPRMGGPEPDWTVVGPFALAAVVATLAGKLVADRLPGPTLARAFAVMIGAVGLAVGVQSIFALLG